MAVLTKEQFTVVATIFGNSPAALPLATSAVGALGASSIGAIATPVLVPLTLVPVGAAIFALADKKGQSSAKDPSNGFKRADLARHLTHPASRTNFNNLKKPSLVELGYISRFYSHGCKISDEVGAKSNTQNASTDCEAGGGKDSPKSRPASLSEKEAKFLKRFKALTKQLSTDLEGNPSLPRIFPYLVKEIVDGSKNITNLADRPVNDHERAEAISDQNGRLAQFDKIVQRILEEPHKIVKALHRLMSGHREYLSSLNSEFWRAIRPDAAARSEIIFKVPKDLNEYEQALTDRFDDFAVPKNKLGQAIGITIGVEDKDFREYNDEKLKLLEALRNADGGRNQESFNVVKEFKKKWVEWAHRIMEGKKLNGKDPQTLAYGRFLNVLNELKLD
jgi:hypothetical protein